MLVSYKVLNKYVDLSDVTPFELANILTNSGIEVEQVREMAYGSDLVIGYVKDAYKHPNSDKLTVCITDVGTETLQICCGAKNVGKDMYVIVAKPGCELKYAKVPVIKKVELGGVESNGMICSLNELGIPEKFQTQEQIEGIEVLDKEYPIGQEALSTLGYDDYLLELSLTPNRSDLYSIYALAIEVAALINKRVLELDMSVNNENNGKYQINIESDDCTSYCLYEFNNFEAKLSSYHKKNELMALGFKPRFNIVDEANIAMVVSGNPVHTFDADKLKSNIFTIRKGIEKDDFVALDNKTYKIVKDDLLIMNGDEIVAIAGVIGSLSSAIDENTKNVVVETAVFSHVSIRNTARRLDLFSEASIRFSKITNPYTLTFPIKLLEDALELKCDKSNVVNLLTYQAKKVEVSNDKITKVLGIEIPFETSVSILKSLSFKVETNDDIIIAYPPSYRKDIEKDVDIIEEIIRVYGYDKLASHLPLQQITYKTSSAIQNMINQTRDIMVNNGLNEIITYQLNSANKLDEFSDNNNYLELLNPISDDRKYFRNQLLSNMLETILYNMSYQKKDLALFEVSDVYCDNQEIKAVSIGMIGNYEYNPFLKDCIKVDFYTIKGIIFRYLEDLGFSYGRILIKNVEKDHKYLHPGKAAYLTINNKIFGYFGAIHPKIAAKYKIKDLYLAQINLTMLSQNVGRTNKYTPFSLLPTITRDLSLIVPSDVDASQITRIAKAGNNKMVKEAKIFDVYYGSELEDGCYSLSISLNIGDDRETLKEDQINEIVTNVLDALNKKLKIKLRT